MRELRIINGQLRKIRSMTLVTSVRMCKGKRMKCTGAEISEQRRAAELAADDGPLAGVHHPVASLQAEDVGNRWSIPLHGFGCWFAEVFV